MLNNMGLGFTLTAKDLTKEAFGAVNQGLGGITGNAEKMSETVGKSLRNVGAVLTVAGAAVGVFLGLASKEAEAFGAGIAEVSTLVDEAQFHIADMNKITLQMAAIYGGDLKSQIKGMYQGISAGATDATASTNLLNAANKLAIGGVTDVHTAVDGLTNILNSYSLSYDHATEVSDAFFVALKSGKTTAAELGATVGQLAPTAGAVGVGFQEMLAAISAVTTKGLDTAQAVTGLKAALANVIKPTTEAAQEAQRLGIHFNAATLRAQGLPGFLNAITSSAKFNKDSMAKLFGSIEGLNAIMALTAGNGETFKGVLDGMADSAGQTDKAFAKMADTAEFQDRRFAALKQTAMVLIGQALQPMQVFATKLANALLTVFTKLPAPMRNFLVIGVAIGAGLMALTGTVIGLVGAFTLLDTAILPALVAIGALMGLLLAAIPPMVLIGLAVYGLKEAFDRNLGGITTKVREFYDRIYLIWEGLGQLFSDGGFSGKVREELNKTQNAGLKQFLIEVFTFAARVQELFTGIGRGFESALGRAAPIFDALGNAFTRLGTAIAHVFGGENDPYKKADAFKRFGNAGEALGGGLERIVNILTTGLTMGMNALSFFIELLGKMRPAFEFAYNAGVELVGTLGELFGSLNGGQTQMGSTSTALTQIASAMAAGIQFTVLFIGVITRLIDGNLKPLIGYIRLVMETFTRLKNAVTGGGFAALGGVGVAASDTTSVSSAKAKSLGLPGATALGTGQSPAAAEVQAVAGKSAGGDEMGGGLLAALTALANKKPDNITAPILLDGDKIGEAILSKQQNGGARAFQPTPSPT